jgi:hypothetical protein
LLAAVQVILQVKAGKLDRFDLGDIEGMAFGGILIFIPAVFQVDVRPDAAL